jgi:nucleotide-binding universal stress UspA family protein
VSQSETALSIRRILVALDASPDSIAALEGALALAARLEGEVAGLFVEDVKLLSAADLSCAREILYPSAQLSRLTRAGLEERLRAHSERVQAVLAEAATRARVPWSFRTVRGEVAAELIAAAGTADLLCLGRLGWSLGSPARIGSTALRLAASTIPVLLHSGSGTLAKRTVAVYYDDSPAAVRALAVAAVLAQEAPSIMILIPAGDREHFLEHEISRTLQGIAAPVRFRTIGRQDKASLLRALRLEEPGLLILGSREPLGESVEEFLRKSRIPVLLLDGGAGSDRTQS